MTALEPMDDSAPADFQCSIIQRAQDTATKPIGFRDALNGIAEGRWAKLVKAVQVAYARGGKEEATAPKKDLPGILFSGTFSKRAASALTNHSGLICADLDELGDRAEALKEQLASDPHVLAAFISPSGVGLKVVFRCDPAKDHKKESFPALQRYVLEHFGLHIDEACSDVSRICFVSHDPELFEADDAKPIPYPPPVTEFKPADINPSSGLELTPGDDFDLRGDLPTVLRNHHWTQVGNTGWRRPDKPDGLSATFGVVPNRFYVFSSSTQFQVNHVYRPWHVYAILEHGGDFAAAARALGKEGFGHQRAVKKLDAPSRQQQNLDRLAGPLPEIAKPEDKPDDVFSRRVRLKSPPPEPVTRLFLAGKPIATPGNLVTLISRAKTGKTATIGAAVAAIIGAHYDRHDLDTFKFSAPHTDEAVVMIDTEQSPYDAWTCHQRSMTRAGQDVDPEWLHHYALVGYGAKRLREELPKVLDKAKADHKGIFTLILDGVADFVASVNDEIQCSEFISWLRAISVSYNCPVICVIHSNEGVKNGDDGRGWLGKELTRKAESNLLLKKVGEITTITSEKQRKAPITEADGVAFRWSDELGRHVSCEVESKAEGKMGGRPKKYHFDQFIQIFPHTQAKASTRAILLRAAQDIAAIKDTAFRDILQEGVDRGDLIRTVGPHGMTYHLSIPGA